MQCLKELSQKHNISIIASIHQPNSDLLQLFDQLYVLAKGGHTVYCGRPQHLTHHLSECHIICNENQVPIESLITYGAKGIEDQRVIEMRNKSKKEIKVLINNRIEETEQKLM